MLTITLLILIIFAILFIDLFGAGEFFKIKKKYDIKMQNKMLNDSLWIKKVIDSCNNRKQLHACSELRKAWFNKYHHRVDKDLLWDIKRELYYYIDLKRSTLM